jgi:hypothetical protein
MTSHPQGDRDEENWSRAQWCASRARRALGLPRSYPLATGVRCVAEHVVRFFDDRSARDDYDDRSSSASKLHDDVAPEDVDHDAHSDDDGAPYDHHTSATDHHDDRAERNT